MVHGTGVGEWAAVSWRPRDGARDAPAAGRQGALGRRSGRVGAGCACGMKGAALNPDGQGVLHGQGELSGRMSAATRRVRV
jgi:hypothetical protein